MKKFELLWELPLGIRWANTARKAKLIGFFNTNVPQSFDLQEVQLSVQR